MNKCDDIMSNKINLDAIISSPHIQELGKKSISILPKDFSDNQRIAIAKAVLYVISIDGIITEEEKQFFTQLCVDLDADNDIMAKAVALSDELMFDTLKTVTDEQETYIMACLNEAANADNELAEEENKLIESFATHFQNGENPKDFYIKILTF